MSGQSGFPRLISSAIAILALSLANVTRAAPAEPGALQVFARRADGTYLRSARDHLALSRDLPTAIAGANEDEAVRLMLSGPSSVPPQIRVSTRRASGALLDSLAELELRSIACPPGATPNATCWETVPLRLTPDRLDRDYETARDRSLEAELGGKLWVEVAGEPLASWPVGAPHSAVFSGIERLSVKLRVRILRVTPGGAPSIGGDSGTALSLAQSEIQAASKLWAQCGIDLRGPAGPDIQVVDPPPIQLVAIGCASGLPASGGEINLRVGARRVKLATRPG